MGPQAEDYIETVLTCEGDYYDPAFHAHLQQFSKKLEELILQDQKKKKLILKKVEPWNSVRVTFNIPKEAALRLKCLAEQGDVTLKELGILAVEIEGDRKISLKIAGKNNETTELVFRTGVSNPPGITSNQNFDLNSSDDMNVPGPSSLIVENTRKNIQDYLQGPASLFENILCPAPGVSSTLNSKTAPIASLANTQSSQGPSLVIPSQMSPKFPTPPPSVSTPNSPNAKIGAPLNTGIGGHHSFGPEVQTIMNQLLGKKSASASPLLVNLLQNEAMQFSSVALSQAISNALPQAVNSMFQQNMNVNRPPFPVETAVPVPPPKKKRRTRKPKDKDGPNKKDTKSTQQQSESAIIQNILNQAVGNGVPQLDPRVPPLVPEQASGIIGTQGTPSKGSTPSSSRAATPAKSPCPVTPKSPLYGQPLAPGQRHIINPITGQLEVVDEDIGQTPPKRDFPPKENRFYDGLIQYPVPQNPKAALNQQSNVSVSIRDNISPGRSQRSNTPFSVANTECIDINLVPIKSEVSSNEGNYATSICTMVSSDAKIYPPLNNTSDYSKATSNSNLLGGQNPLVQSNVSQTVSPDFPSSNVASMPQTISAILSNVSKSSSIALATLNLPTVQDSLPNAEATMQNNKTDSRSSPSNIVSSTSLVSEMNNSLTVTWSSVQTSSEGFGLKSNQEVSVQSSLLTNPAITGTNSSALTNLPLTMSSLLSTSSAFKNSDLNIGLPSTANGVPLITTSQTVGNAGSVSQGQGAINVNISSMGPTNNSNQLELNEICRPTNQHNFAQKPTHPQGVQEPVVEHQGPSVESTLQLVNTDINGGNIESNSRTSSGINKLTHPHDSEHNSQSCEDHVKHGSGSVDSGLGDIKENNGESPCGSSGNDSPGVTVSSSGNRDSDNEKDKDISQSDKNVITVGYVLSKSENPPMEKSICDRYVKCNHEDIESLVQKQLFSKTSTATRSPDLCDSLLSMPSLLKLQPSAKTEDPSILNESLTEALNWNGRSDLNPGGIPNGEEFQFKELPPSKVAAEKDIGEDRSSLVQVCSNDTKVLDTAENKNKILPEIKKEPSHEDPICKIDSSKSNEELQKPSKDEKITSESVKTSKTEDEPAFVNGKEKFDDTNHQKPEHLFFQQDNIIIDHVHDIHSYSEIKVTDDNTVIINTKDPNSTGQVADTSSTVPKSDFGTVNKDLDDPSLLIKQVPTTSTHSPTIESIASILPLHQDTVDVIEQKKIRKMPVVIQGHVIANSVIVNSNVLENEVHAHTNGPLSLSPCGSVINTIIAPASVEKQPLITRKKFLFETHKVSVDSNLNLELSPKSSVLPNLEKPVASESIQVIPSQPSPCTTHVGRLLSSVTSVATISTIAPSIGSVPQIHKSTCVVSGSLNTLGPHGMGSLGPTPIMSTGLPYFNATPTIQETESASPTSEIAGSEKHIKGQKGISIMKPLRDRESSIDEDLLESPVKDKKGSPRKTDKQDKPVAAALVNKRSNFTVAQLLDEADKVKQNQSFFRPYVGSDKNENLFNPSSITASAALKQMAKSMDDISTSSSNEKLDKTDIVNKTVPNLLKSFSVNYSSSSINNSSISMLQPAAIISTAKIPRESPQHTHTSTTTTKWNKPNEVVFPKHMTITAPEFHLNLTESVHQVMKAVQHTSSIDTTSPSVSPSLVNVTTDGILHDKNTTVILSQTTSSNPVVQDHCDIKSGTKLVEANPKSISTKLSPPRSLSKTVTLETVTLDTLGNKSAKEFIKIEPEPAIPATVKNVIVKSSPLINASNIKDDDKTVDVASLASSEFLDVATSSSNVINVQKISKYVTPCTVNDFNSPFNSALVHEHSYSARPNQQHIVHSDKFSPHSSELVSISKKCEFSAIEPVPSLNLTSGTNHLIGSKSAVTVSTWVNKAISSNETTVVKSLSNKCAETISGSSSGKNTGKPMQKELGKTLTITGSKMSESKELTKVTLDLRSAVTHPGSVSKFIKLEPGKDWGPSSINKVGSNITVKVNSEVEDDNQLSVDHGYTTCDFKEVTNSVSFQVKPETPPELKQVKAISRTENEVHLKGELKRVGNNSTQQTLEKAVPVTQSQEKPTISPKLIQTNKRKSLDSINTQDSDETPLGPPTKILRTSRRQSSDNPSHDSDSVKVPARVTRRSSRGSNDSKASSTDGIQTDDYPYMCNKIQPRKNSKGKLSSEWTEITEIELVGNRRNSVSSVERSVSPLPQGTKNSKNIRRRASEKEKTPDNLDDPSSSNIVNDNHARATRSSKRKHPVSEEKEIALNTENSSLGKKQKTDEVFHEGSMVESCPNKREFLDINDASDAGRKAPSRLRNAKNKNESKVAVDQAQSDTSEIEKTAEAKENTACKRSTRSTRSVEHCELPNNYVTKKKPKTH